jgi:hypothetical protein
VYYIREVTVALTSVRDEARDLAFMDLGAPYKPGGTWISEGGEEP